MKKIIQTKIDKIKNSFNPILEKIKEDDFTIIFEDEGIHYLFSNEMRYKKKIEKYKSFPMSEFTSLIKLKLVNEFSSLIRLDSRETIYNYGLVVSYDIDRIINKAISLGIFSDIKKVLDTLGSGFKESSSVKVKVTKDFFVLAFVDKKEENIFIAKIPLLESVDDGSKVTVKMLLLDESPDIKFVEYKNNEAIFTYKSKQFSLYGIPKSGFDTITEHETFKVYKDYMFVEILGFRFIFSYAKNN